MCIVPIPQGVIMTSSLGIHSSTVEGFFGRGELSVAFAIGTTELIGFPHDKLDLTDAVTCGCPGRTL
ncbi:hypothetical protein [Streptomyces sp. NBC_01198]|uniref:hypothetical protein n=1 Tax=Streptomyces sp. NBC_01198 TaxID=2903769 RepID=UPI002E0ECAD5|nr:hypothetical protein OG702_06565 [Streptomyces sp. NBC_01198]